MTAKNQSISKQPFVRNIRDWSVKQRQRQRGYLSRRPHRSFRLTRRRDYVRSLELPGYWSFTLSVFSKLKAHKKLFIGLTATYAALNAIFVGLSSQDAYAELTTFLEESGSAIEGGVDRVTQAGLVLFSGLTGSFAPQLSDVQQVYGLLFGLLLWLTTVWLLRAIIAGNTPKLRDGLYNAGAPIIATGIVSLVLLVQLIPLALTAIVMNAAITSGVLANAFVSMAAWTASLLIGVMTLYWITSTVIALIVVTLPGMYPWQAIRTAGDLVIGRRVRILLRFIWLMLVVAVLWVIIVVPVIVIEGWLRGFWNWLEAVPIVPIVVLLTTSFATVFSASYTYMLYRKVVEDDAEPA